MRLFVAIDLSEAVKDELSRVIEALRPGAPEAKWVPRDNLHLTLAFLGEVGEQRLRAVSTAVGSVAGGVAAFESRLEEVGTFPSPRRARVVWVGLADAGGGLAGLADACAEALEPLGFPPERRAFTPHLTLARFRRPADASRLPEVGIDPAPFAVEALTLFRSHLARPAPRYEALAEFPLGAG